MSTNPMKEQEPFFSQDFAFSTNYLDYDIPDFRGIVNAAIPVLVHGNVILTVIEGSPRPLDAQSFPSWITDIQSRKIKLRCNDAVGFHRAVLDMAENSAEWKEMVWQLTDSYSLWAMCLVRILEGVEPAHQTFGFRNP